MNVGDRAVYRLPSGVRVRCTIAGPRERRGPGSSPVKPWKTAGGRGRHRKQPTQAPAGSVSWVYPVTVVEASGVVGQRVTRVVYAPVERISQAGADPNWPPELGGVAQEAPPPPEEPWSASIWTPKPALRPTGKERTDPETWAEIGELAEDVNDGEMVW